MFAIIRITIVVGILGFVFILLNMIGLPTTLPTQFTSSLQTLVTYAYAFDWIIPISTLFIVLKWAIAFEIGVFVWRVMKWVLHLTTTATSGT